MPSFSDEFEIETDDQGAYSVTKTVNPPGPEFLTFTVEVTARILSPAGARVVGTVDIDGAAGKPRNTEHGFVLGNESVSLGAWKLGGGDNTVIVSGQTTPALPKAKLRLELRAFV